MADVLLKQVKLGSQPYEIAGKYIQDGSDVKTWEDIKNLVATGFEIKILDELPIASESTWKTYGKSIVLIPGGISGSYTEYVILRSGSEGSYTYAWEKIGTTATDLSDYLKKDTEYIDAALTAGAHTHDVSGTVTVPTVTKVDKYLGLNKTDNVEFIKSYAGAKSKLDTQSIIPAVSNGTASKATAGTAKDVAKAGTAVTFNAAGEATSVATVGAEKSIAPAVAIAEGNRPTKTVFGTATTASKVTIGSSSAAASKASAGTAVVYGTADVGTTVTDVCPLPTYDNGVLTFGSGLSITPAKAADISRTITPYTFTDVDIPTISADDVTVPVVSSNAEIAVAAVGTAVTFNAAGTAVEVATVGEEKSIVPAVSNGTITPYTFADVDVAKAGTAVTAAIGTVSADGTGAELMTGLGEATKGTAVTAVSLDGSAESGLAYVQSVTVGSASANLTNGSAASAGAHQHNVKVDSAS